MIHCSQLERAAKEKYPKLTPERDLWDVCFIYRYIVLSSKRSLNFRIKIVKCQQTSVSLGKLCKISNLNLANITSFFIVWLNLFSLLKLAFVLKSDIEIDYCKGKQEKSIWGGGIVYIHDFIIFKPSFLFYLFGKNKLCHNALPASVLWNSICVINCHLSLWKMLISAR